MTGLQQTRTSSAPQLTRRMVFLASAALVPTSTAGGALQNALAAEGADCVVMEKSARVLSLLQAERTAFAALAALERQLSTQLPRPPAGPDLCRDTDSIQGLEEKISYDEENLANWRRSRMPEIRRFADCHEKEETDCVRTRLSLLTKFELDVARHNDQVKLDASKNSGRIGDVGIHCMRS